MLPRRYPQTIVFFLLLIQKGNELLDPIIVFMTHQRNSFSKISRRCQKHATRVLSTLSFSLYRLHCHTSVVELAFNAVLSLDLQVHVLTIFFFSPFFTLSPITHVHSSLLLYTSQKTYWFEPINNNLSSSLVQLILLQNSTTHDTTQCHT